MRFSAFPPKFLSLLAVPVLTVMLALPAIAEPTPEEMANPSSPEAAAPATSPDTTSEQSPSDTGAPEPGEASEQPNAAESTADAEPETPKSSVVVNIDKASQEMTVFVDGVELYTWPVSTGMSRYFTPSGSYTASSMNKIWYSKQWDNAPMPHAIFFTKKGHAIHGTNEVKNLGKPASHGCVRLSPQNAQTLFNLVKANGLEHTEVILTGMTPGGERAYVASPQQRDEYWLPPGYREKPRKRRRGLFGRRWFDPPDRGYYAPRGRYYYPPRGVGPRGY